MQRIQKYISTYRNEIKGVAILWVVFFHAVLQLSGILYEVQKIGYGGVDLFLFLSGFGLCCSLQKDHELGSYLKRRASRLLPAYLPFCLCWLAVMIPLYGEGLVAAVRIAAGNLFMIGYFGSTPLMINWYVSMIALTILLAPVFYACIRPKEKSVLRCIALLAVLFVIGLAYVSDKRYAAVSRLPVFALGMMFALPCEKELKGLGAALWAAFVLGMAVLYGCYAYFPELLYDYAMHWHPFVLIAPAMCVGIAWLFARLPVCIKSLFAVLGRASFEIFLFNVWLEILAKKYGLAKTPMQWALWSAATVLVGLGYHWLIGKIVRKVVDNHR